MRFRDSLALALVLGFTPLPCSANTGEAGEGAAGYIVAALHVDTPTGRRFVEGIEEAIQDHPFGTRVRLENRSYANEEQGFEELASLVEEERVDLVLGPTDSGVFQQAVDRRQELEDHGIPVISSLVAADVPHQENGWFFRTNVGVQQRAATIYDYLNKYWVRSIAVLSADTEFGRQAETSFRKELDPGQKELYRPLVYSSLADGYRAQLRKILDSRPEAVGIIGDRQDVAHLRTTLRQMNDWRHPYDPILFTLIDMRVYSHRVEDLYFVSVAEKTATGAETEGSFDDVKGLSYDSTTLVLDELQRLEPGLDLPERRKAFRDAFEARLRGPIDRGSRKTRIQFSNYENIGRPMVFRMEDGRPQRIDLRSTVGLREKLRRKLDLVRARFGTAPLINILLLVAISFGVSFVDIKKWFSGKVRTLLRPRNYHALLLPAVNTGLVLGLYVAMGETGNIRYDSTLAALALAVAPLALLRSTIFESAAGRSIGLGKLYESFLQWINSRLMVSRHRQIQPMVNLVAYHNPVEGMKSHLKEIYTNERNPAQRVRLMTELDERVNDRLSYAERRKACARLLLRNQSWDELQEDGLAPGPGEPEDFKDPETAIREAARYCAGDPERMDALKEKIRQRLELESEERRTELKAAHDRDLAGIVGAQGRMRKRLAFLLVLRGYEDTYLRDQGFLPPAEAPAAPETREPGDREVAVPGVPVQEPA